MAPLHRLKHLLVPLHSTHYLGNVSRSLSGTIRLYSTSDNTNLLGDGGVHSMSPAFQKNKEFMDTLVEKLHEDVTHALKGGGDKACERHKARSKLLPRERIAALLDPGSPFFELSQLAGFGLYGEYISSVCTRYSQSNAALGCSSTEHIAKLRQKTVDQHHLANLACFYFFGISLWRRQGRCSFRRNRHWHRQSAWQVGF